MRRLLLCLTGVIVLAACGGDRVPLPAAATATTTAPGVTSASSAATSVVPESLAFSAPRVGGGTVNMADYAGTPVLVWFWAPT